jgi:hypothetical protein
MLVLYPTNATAERKQWEIMAGRRTGEEIGKIGLSKNRARTEQIFENRARTEQIFENSGRGKNRNQEHGREGTGQEQNKFLRTVGGARAKTENTAGFLRTEEEDWQKKNDHASCAAQINHDILKP